MMKFRIKYIIKYIISLVLATSAILWLGGCAVTMSPLNGLIYTNVARPLDFNSAKQNRSYQVLGEVDGTASATLILGILASGDASVQKAHEQAFSKYPGTEGLIDVSIDQNFNSILGIVAKTTTILRAKAVKWLDKESIIAIQIAKDSTFIAVAAVNTPPQVSSPSSSGPNFDFAPISRFLAKGTLNHNVNLALSNLAGEPGGAGIRLGYRMRRTGAKFTFSPAISFGSVYKKSSQSYYDWLEDKEQKITNKTIFRVVPIELNVAANFEEFVDLAKSIPDKIKPFAEAGLVPYFWKSANEINGGDAKGGNWSLGIGLDFGIGAEYYLKPDMAIQGALKRYFTFSQDFGFWNYQIGMTFSPKSEAK